MENTIESERVAAMAKRLTDYARKHGVNFMCITDIGEMFDFDTTGSPEWSQDAADILTEWSMNLIDEDENSKIDELLTPIYNLENDN